MGSDTNGLIARAPRFRLRKPIVLHLPEGHVKGHSLDVSESGMLAVFEEPLDDWLTGRLFTLVGETSLGIEVRVARVNGREAGLTFHNISASDRATIQELLGHAGKTPLAPYL
jgi:hypothetical protein